MAIRTVSKEKQWFDYQPEAHDNREADVEDPMILQVRFLTPQEKQLYYTSLGMKRRRKVKGEDIQRVSRKIFIENVKIKSGCLHEGKPNTDVEVLFDNMPSQELLDDIDQALSDYQFLIDGDPKNFKTKK